MTAQDLIFQTTFDDNDLQEWIDYTPHLIKRSGQICDEKRALLIHDGKTSLVQKRQIVKQPKFNVIIV